MTASERLPVAVVGAGPVGLAAAAHLIERGLPVKVYEAGETVGASVRSWGHVRLFSPWEFNVDPAARAILLRHGWQEPPADVYPTGSDLVGAYLGPLAETPELAAVVETGTSVSAIGRQGLDKVVTNGREARPFALAVTDKTGRRRRDLARAVIDASGTWTNPNPMGAGGMLAEGEGDLAGRISYRIPDVLGRDRTAYAGLTTLVVGAGHSAANVLLDLARLAERSPASQMVWVTRSTNLARVFGGGAADQLAARGELGSSLRSLVESGRVTLVTGFWVTAVRAEGEGLVVEGETAEGVRSLGPVDRIVAVTGQRPDLAMTRELRLELDPWLESTRALGPLIDPNQHSCGTVYPHGHRELSHPEPGFYTAGIKSYGRAPTFLMVTGYEQVRSIAAAIAGDIEAADAVELKLPETGVCSTSRPDEVGAASSCCGGPAPAVLDACCVQDQVAKAEIGQGCGCGPSPVPTPARPQVSCCGKAA
ncbi:FAD-dependent oxidoreductase [uncultured Enterovirga sp.]|uniref:FAD-dependent oxidoreductase n=1 Tax=uncultured Enterovirga sp. TaxID=2026352 RepID=UPI0035CCA0FE